MRKHRIGEHVVDVVIGRVLAAGDFLENDLALGENVLVREGRVDEHVGENLEAEGETLVKQARVEAGVLARGEGVEFSTQRIERSRDVERTARRRALEEHVLHEMGHAVFGRRLVAATHAHPETERRGAHALHMLGNDRYAVVEYGFLVKHESSESAREEVL